MEPLQIVLIVLAVAGVWAVVELALTLRKSRSTIQTVDRAVGELNETLGEARPVIAKLDTTLDDLQPALNQVEPLLKQGSIAIEALSADLIEVNGVLRDVSEVTGSMSSASGAVSGIASAASEKVQRLFSKHGVDTAATDRAIADRTSDVQEDRADAADSHDEDPDGAATPESAPRRQYYTYDDPVTEQQEKSDE
ncbi:DUF948 domain-containing protein [Collinsella tanakaei]|uniref:DUF948 domain-containing protein n=1 Tax=Collinsella tanakaei TaxID=626935 RepID=UPI001F2B9B80|nr:DUF948 domain-containing protein [Collinsella tanakaei]MCF2620759.1 hypothetical protein [Collinsella tanakaei]